jgi:hypothetical protein
MILNDPSFYFKMLTKVYWAQENIKANLGTLMTANQVYNI